MQRECLRHFVGERRVGWAARALLRANALWPAEGLLPEVQLRDGHARCEEGLALGEPGYVAFQIGTPGPYQKASALYVTAQGEGVALAKTAMSQTADAMVRGEAAWLEALADIDTLTAQVPVLHGEGETEEGRRYLVTSVAPSTRSSARALASVSSYSFAGTESATMPAPACTYARPPTASSVRMAMAVSMAWPP